jgi:6-phosphogluconolactonase (cycloisomerase 2 family)
MLALGSVGVLSFGAVGSAQAAGGEVYVANYGDNTVSQYTATASGTLTEKSPATVATGSNPALLAVGQSGGVPKVTSVYVPNFGDGTISEYTVSPSNGTLVPKSSSAVPAGVGAIEVATNPTAQSAYVTNEMDGTVSQYTVLPNGALSPKSPATIATPSPLGIAVRR